MSHVLLAWEPWHTLIEWSYWPESDRGYAFFSSVGGTPLFALGALGSIFAIYKQHNCKAHWWCPFWGHHDVKGTTDVVCHMHHTAAEHRRLQRLHQSRHRGRLAHGESPEPSDRPKGA